jgi:hypothetical protein
MYLNKCMSRYIAKNDYNLRRRSYCYASLVFDYLICNVYVVTC